MFFPHDLLQFVVQEKMNTSSGVIDIRATYGGMSVGVGMVLYLLARDDATLNIGLIAVFILVFGMACGRTIGMIVDGDPNNLMYLYLILELTVSALALLLLRISKKKVA